MTRIDLLKLVTQSDCWTEGDWISDGGKLESPKDQRAILEIPYQLPDEYKMTAVVQPLDPPDTLILGQRMGGRRFLTMLNDGTQKGPQSAIRFVHGKDAESFIGSLFTKDQVSVIIATVHKVSIRVSVSDDTIIDWKGESSLLTSSEHWTTPNEKALMIGSYSCRYRFHHLRIESLSGKGRVLDVTVEKYSQAIGNVIKAIPNE